MIADDKRNGAYKAALARAVADVLKKQSTCDVLDVGAGSEIKRRGAFKMLCA